MNKRNILMKKVKVLFEKVDYKLNTGRLHGEISELVFDTRKVSKGCLFVCIKGALYDSHEHINEIIKNGAKVVVVEQDNYSYKELKDKKISGATIVEVKDSREALAILSASYFDNPASKLKVIGITGTKGKTTTTYMVKSILENAGFSVGLIGTIEIIYADYKEASKNTTPESYELQRHFANMVNKGIDICVMEVSSQALMLHRVSGFVFEMGIFTNISPDHIGPNEHTSFENYLQCKSMLFKNCKYAIINGDDEYAEYIMSHTRCEVLTYGFKDYNDLYASDTSLINEGGVLGVEYNTNGVVETDIRINMPGEFSVYNSLTAIAICNKLGIDTDTIKPAILNAKVKGRIEMLEVSDNYTVLIDYAHNAMSLKALLQSLRAYEPKRLVVLFGCGGNRSKERRYEMGEVAAKYADYTIITSDNPRHEEPQRIIEDIIVGYSYGISNKTIDFEEATEDMIIKARKTLVDHRNQYIEIPDRIEAIGYILTNAKMGDVVVLAGKGHEDYQIIGDTKHHMDEREIVYNIKNGIDRFSENLFQIAF